MTLVVVHMAAYDDDFFAWTQQQSTLLRERADEAIDWANVAEEIESLGRSERRELRSRLRILLQHLLKWNVQPAHRSGSWKATLAEQRLRVEDLLQASPSLRREVPDLCDDVFEDAVLLAISETGLARSAFPATSPYEVANILSPTWLPE